MNPAQFEWQTRCEFNAYCKHTLRNELIDALRESKKRERNEVSFSALTPQEEKQLYTVDKYFANEDEETFCAGGLKITAKLLADAMHSLPDEKRRTVLLYYFFEMTDAEIAELMKIPRSTVQYRRTSSFLGKNDLAELYERMIFRGIRAILVENQNSVSYNQFERKVVVDQHFIEYEATNWSESTPLPQKRICFNGFGAVTF